MVGFPSGKIIIQGTAFASICGFLPRIYGILKLLSDINCDLKTKVFGFLTLH
jgi:hypothetical protein